MTKINHDAFVIISFYEGGFMEPDDITILGIARNIEEARTMIKTESSSENYKAIPFKFGVVDWNYGMISLEK